MSIASKSLRAGAYVLLGMGIGLFVGLGIGKLGMAADRNANPADIPRRVVTISLGQDQQEDLFNQLRKFADKWAYAIRIAPTDASNESFLVQLWRTDIKASGLYPNGPGTLSLGFFYTESTRPVPLQYFDEEIADLRSFIVEMPGVTFSVK